MCASVSCDWSGHIVGCNKVEQEEGNPVSALDVAMNGGLSPCPVQPNPQSDTSKLAGM